MSSVDIEELYRAHARRIASYLMRATGDAEVAADLTTETFAAARVRRGSPHARINWLDEHGKLASGGIGLIPPITRR